MATTVRERTHASLWASKGGIGNRGDQVFRWVVTALAVSILVLVALIVFKMVDGSMLSISTFGPGFLSGTTWDPVFRHFGALPFIFGTLVTSLLALLIGGPIAVSYTHLTLPTIYSV